MKNIKKMALTSAMILGTIASTSSTVFAADTAVKTLDSNAKVGFEAPKDGGLTLVKVADLDFGTNPISSKEENYKNINTDTAKVSDLRGTNAGWTVTVKQNGTFKNGSNELAGAEITLGGSADNNTNVTSAKITDQPTQIWSATAPEGALNSTMTVGKGQANLMVPANTKEVVGTYTTTLTWELADGAANK